VNIAILSLTTGGSELSERLVNQLAGAVSLHCRGTLRSAVEEAWPCYNALIFIMSTGIVVRTIAPLLTDKYRDPAVVVCDETGRFAVSLLSGHLGGANELARRVAHIMGGQAVITTASDVTGHTALDLWIRDLGLTVSEPSRLAGIMGKLVDRGFVTLHTDYPLAQLPPDILPSDDPQTADLLITVRSTDKGTGLILVPRALVVGIGCNRGTDARAIDNACTEVLTQHGLLPDAIRNLASIDLKQDELGLLAFAAGKGYEIDFFSSGQLNEVANVSESQAVLRATGAKGVAEPAAILSSGNNRLIVRKVKCKDVTIAVAEVFSPWSEQVREPSTS